MPSLMTPLDPEGLLEYSVVYTDRALNHMSDKFKSIVGDLVDFLTEAYGAHHLLILPGSGTSGMEAVARQLGHNKKILCLRNGFFNYRWSQIFSAGKIAKEEKVLLASADHQEKYPTYSPVSLEEVRATIEKEEPDLVFATHVETSSGIELSEEYIRQVGESIHKIGGLLVLDCIASGATLINMEKLGVDIITSAPQKNWSASPGCALILLNNKALDQVKKTQSDSFALDLNSWRTVMEAYREGGHAYYATLPTDILIRLRDAIWEAKKLGFTYLKEQQQALWLKIRHLLQEKGFYLVADRKWASNTIVVAYADRLDIHNGQAFSKNGVQVAAGVPLKCNEPADFSTFRLGLIGIDKLLDIERTTRLLAEVLNKVIKL